MTKQRAEEVLELTGATYSINDLNAAYREKVRSAHPDAGGTQSDMVEVNAAKEYLASLFKDDKNMRVTPSAMGGEAPISESVPEPTPEERAKAAEAAAAIHDIFSDIYANNGSENDAAFYDGGDYTRKPQGEWSEDDWNAFNEFMPPSEWHKDEYVLEKMKAWDGLYAQLADAGNIDTSKWRDADWYYYWFTNARNRRDDGRVYTRLEATALYGPHAQRARARSKKGYYDRCESYKTGRAIQTDFGFTFADSFERYGWKGNAGVPYAFAMCEDYARWREINYEAAEAARALGKRKERKREISYAPDWAGEQWLKPEDAWVAIDPVIPKTEPPVPHANAADSVSDNAATATVDTGAASDTTSTASKPEFTGRGREADYPPIGSEAAAQSWTARKQRAAGAAYRNMGVGGDAEPFGKGNAYYNRNNVEGMPGWYKAANTVLNHIPWRTLAWAAFFIVVFTVAAPSQDSMTIGLTLVCGFALCLINQTGFFTNYIRGALRGLLDGALKIWEKSSGTEIDWSAARSVSD